MIKLELGEVAVIMAMIENTNFNGKDVLKVADIIRKLQKEKETHQTRRYTLNGGQRERIS